MVNTIELLGTFYGNYITYIFHHANHLVLAHSIAADIAKVFIRNIMAAAAEFDLFSKRGNGIAETYYILHILFNKVQYQTQRRFFTNTWQFGKLVYSIF